MVVIEILLSLMLLYLGFNILYLCLFSCAAIFCRKRRYSIAPGKKRIAILIPAYKEDSVIVETARMAISHNYPVGLFDVFIIADSLQKSTVNLLSTEGVNVVEVCFPKSTKAKSIKAAVRQLPDDSFDILVILDADNIMDRGCLEKINHAFSDGFKMVQLHRTAKNRNTATAILDAASEEINNHIFRRGHRALGISSALIGSGMAFDFSIFKRLMMETDIEDNPGEDREIYLEMLRLGYVCEYIGDGLVFDEKVQVGSILEKQRTRWISAQFQYAVRFWIKEPFKTFSYNIHYFDYAIQTILLPRVLLLVGLFAVSVLSYLILFITGHFYLLFILFLSCFILCVLVFLLSVYKYFSIRELLSGILHLPNTIKSFLKAFFSSRFNQSEFIHTPKNFSKFSDE